MENNDTLIGKSSFFRGDIFGKSIIVEGTVVGNLKATSSILIKEAGRVDGNIQAPNIYLAKGCHHEGDIYLDDLEQASSAKINMNEFEFSSDGRNVAKTEENKSSEEQPVSSRPKSKLW